MRKARDILHFLFGFEQKSNDIPLSAIEQGMKRRAFPLEVQQEIMELCDNMMYEKGEQGFQQWAKNLHYRLPTHFAKETVAYNLYHKCPTWIEREIKKLEEEVQLNWEKQAEDLHSQQNEVRKTQLVIRDRLSQLIDDIRDEPEQK
ncbi:hypothetical protein [Salirhabdus salicampi]|uniref:hypothetical protein n=1 Tax=Salirhabdus salicampi TaxID=476102 RepID=UPI0020C499BD|nr:hypothetical protein [Salirhabdus salicampi]MCP8616779.1 hypothetical protein [Salirhabdus salicampi]